MELKIGIRQDDAIRDGGNEYGVVHVDVDMTLLSEKQREVLLEAGSRDAVYWLGVGVPTQEAVIAAINTNLARKEAAEAETAERQEAAVQELMATPQDEYNVKGDSEYISSYPSIQSARDDPRLVERQRIRLEYRREEQERVDLERGEAEALRKEEERAKKAANDELATLKLQTEGLWVANHGTLSQQARYEAGMLPVEELDEAMAAQIFQSANDWPLYELLTEDDVPCECEWDPCKVSFVSWKKDSATHYEWEQLHQLQSLLPAAQITLREHVGERYECEVRTKRTGLLAEITLEGGIEFRREYGVKECLG